MNILMNVYVSCKDWDSLSSLATIRAFPHRVYCGNLIVSVQEGS